MAKKKTIKEEEKKEKKKEEWKPTGRKLEGKELEDYYNAFSEIEDSIAALYKKSK